MSIDIPGISHSALIPQDGWFEQEGWGENSRPFMKSMGYPDDVIEELHNSLSTLKFKTNDQGVEMFTYIGLMIPVINLILCFDQIVFRW